MLGNTVIFTYSYRQPVRSPIHDMIWSCMGGWEQERDSLYLSGFHNYLGILNRECVRESLEVPITKLLFTFMHLADAFIQSDLQLHSGYTFLLVHVFPGNRTHNLSLSWRNVLPLSHTGTLYFQTYWKTNMLNIKIFKTASSYSDTAVIRHF